MPKLEDVEGIGKTYAAKLQQAGIRSQDGLLKAGGDKKGRKEIAKNSGISEKLILEWVNRADLGRVKGVGSEYADLLECVGVDTVKELAQRNATSLFTKMEEVNGTKKLVRKLPTKDQITDWIKQAKQLPRAVSH